MGQEQHRSGLPVQPDTPAPSYLRHNFIALLIDYVFFGVAFSFLSPSTVLPAFVRTLTDSEPMVGLINTVLNGGWLLPQLGGAAMMAGKARKRPYLVAMIYLGRPLFLFLALAVWLGGVERPPLMLGVFFLVIGLFTITDSIASVAWFDIVARAIPMTRRGRLVGTGQLLSGLLGIGVGMLVTRILESPRLPYPNDYALIFALAAVAFLPSTVALTLIREPPAKEEEPHRSLADFLRRLGEVWRKDPRFRCVIRYRLLVGTMGLALPFYIVHATEVAGLPKAAQGWFISAQTIGGIIASVGLGWLSDRRGPRPVIWLGAFTALLCPLLALTVHLIPSLAFLYLLLYFLLGVNNNSWMQGPINYVLEMAPEGRRPLYIGLYNTLAGTLVAVPLAGGVLLRLSSYPVLFAVTALGIGAGLGVSLGLEEPQDQAAA